ncbi:hypothetical protein ACVDG8_001755 [Mesorhizobium sp. ORM8.1]
MSIGKALETDHREMFVLALTQHGNEQDRAAFREIVGEFSANEREIIGVIRKFSKGADPNYRSCLERYNAPSLVVWAAGRLTKDLE